MPENDPTGPTDGDNASQGADAFDPNSRAYLERQFALASSEILEKREQEIARKRASTVESIRQALDIRTEIVTDPARAPVFAKRHNAHVQSSNIAEQAFAAWEGSEKGKQFFAALRKHAAENGIFVYPYEDQLEAERITDTHGNGAPKFLMIEAFGRHPDPSHPRHTIESSAADAQFQLAEATKDAETILSWPSRKKSRSKRDVIDNDDLVDEMKKKPHAIAVLEDIASDPDMGHLRLAGSAMNRGIYEIVHNINQTRGEFPIEFIAAEIVSIQGVVFHNNRVVQLQKDLQITPVANGRSLILFEHFNSPNCESFERAWLRRGIHVPVEHADVKAVLINMNVMVSRLKKPTQ